MVEPVQNEIVVAVLVADGVTATDAVNAAEALAMVPGATVKFVGPAKGPQRTWPGAFHLVADYTLDEVPDPDVIVVPADLSSFAHGETLAWLQRAHETSQWTTSVCAGALTLGAAGILAGKQASTHWFVRDLLEAMGAKYVAERWVRDGKVVTAAGNSAGIDMVLFLIGEIAGPEVARAVQLGMEYDPAPPFDSGSLRTADAATVELATRFIQAGLTEAGAPLAMIGAG